MSSPVAARDVTIEQPQVRSFTVPSAWLADEDSRFDATIYAQEGYEALRIINKSPFEKKPLGELVKRVYHPTQNQPRSNFKRIWVQRGEGPPFLTGRQLFFFRPDREKFVSRKMPKIGELLLPQQTILLSRSGTTGYPVMVGRWLSQFAVTDDALRIFPGEAPIGFVYAFLASSLGRPLVVKNEYGSTVSHLEAKHVHQAPVPIIPDRDQLKIHEQILNAYSIRDAANDLLDEADRRLHDLLQVGQFSEDDIEYFGGTNRPRAFSANSQDLGLRLDASHHVPVVQSVIHKLERGAFPLCRLDRRVNKIYVAPRFARVYVEQEYGTPLLQGSQLPAMKPVGMKCISNTATDRIERWIIRSGSVLVTCSGTIGRVALASKSQDRWAASQHILRIVPRDGDLHPGFLAAFLASPFGQHQLKAKIYGGVVDEITEADTAAIFVPEIRTKTSGFEEQTAIGELVAKAYEMRDEANRIEAAAVARFESIVRRP